MQYQLNIDIDPAGLSSIYGAGQVVAIIGGAIANPPTDSMVSVVWVSFQPLEQNTVVFTDSYYIYATTADAPLGAPIVMNAQTTDPAQPGWLYTLSDGFFQGTAGNEEYDYRIANGMPSPPMSFGLACEVSVNDAASTLGPISAGALAYGKQVGLTPTLEISVFVMTPYGAPAGSPANGPALDVYFSHQKPTVTIQFDDATNAFVTSSGTNG